MKVLVTGATGLVGANVARALLAANHTVRVGVRPTSNRRGVEDLEVEEVLLALEDEASDRAAMEDCEVVIHAAAAVWIGRTGRETLERVNVEGTRTICRAAADAGVRRLVHVSSVDALGLRTLEEPADEACAPNMAWLDCAYVDTKLAAERVVLQWCSEGLDAVIVNPGYMIGPWDVRPSSGQMVLEVARGLARLAPAGGNCFVDVRDVADGVLRALDKGVTGRRYILGGENLTYLEAWGLIARVVGVSGPIGVAPRPLLWTVGQAGALVGRVTGVEPAVNPISVVMGGLPHYFDSTRAKQELGYQNHELTRAVHDAWTWFGDAGYV